MALTLKDVGRFCGKVRRKHGVTQVHVAMSVNYSPENVSAFEKGHNNNAMLLAYYLDRFSAYEAFRDFMRGVDE